MSNLPQWRYIKQDKNGKYYGAQDQGGPWHPIPSPQTPTRLWNVPSPEDSAPAPDTIHGQALRIVDRLAIVGGADAILRQAIRLPVSLPANVARCPGEGSWEDGQFHWREGCEDCLRRTSPGGQVTVKPPKIITFWCESRIDPDEVV